MSLHEVRCIKDSVAKVRQVQTSHEDKFLGPRFLLYVLQRTRGFSGTVELKHRLQTVYFFLRMHMWFHRKLRTLQCWEAKDVKRS